jgi:hypothetical protein
MRAPIGENARMNVSSAFSLAELWLYRVAWFWSQSVLEDPAMLAFAFS